ncbi:MAG: hypothetical protein DRO90_01190 [Candidatus Altiarchaeales archaeon]|nr:MAG: hypothetical protein DRO95_00865 [Candidatus Altiarchaeales archaeon]RLI94935.1 MAG: hypothetical protein DRO90_01190 [Candidatus Altiarchaeales archaeon]HDO82853.1 hypothetical protein [Candidatus Altiarchaeales archaeon]HEX55502.1 hypothetical protein [Candidatus Altiarchaeales archaeon]
MYKMERRDKGGIISRVIDRVSKIIYKGVIILARVFSIILINLGNFIAMILRFFFNILKPFIHFFVKFTVSIQYKLGTFFPSNIKKSFENTLLYAGITRNSEKILGMAALYSIILPITAGIIGYFVFKLESKMVILTAIISFVLVWIIMYMIISSLIDRRTSSIEKTLPDMLSLISQNMIAGMTPYNALWVSARPEFGPLAAEIQRVAKDTLAGIPLDEALINMTKRIKSEKLERTVKLMIQGMSSGGELPTVLQGISKSIQSEQNLFKKMQSETSAQAMFILFSIIFGAPLLFAASSQFIRIFSEIFSQMNLEEVSYTATMHAGLTIRPIPVDYEFFVTYSIIVLVTLSFFGSLLIGLMKNGKLTSGIPIIPVLIGLSIAVFFLLQILLSTIFSGITNMGAVS